MKWTWVVIAVGLLSMFIIGVDLYRRSQQVPTINPRGSGSFFYIPRYPHG